MSRSPEVLRLLGRALLALAEEQASAPQTEGTPPIPWLPIQKCGIPEKTARRLVREHVITGSRVGKSILVKRDDVLAYVEANKIGGDTNAANEIEGNEGNEVDRAIARRRLRALRGGRQ